MLCGRRPFQGPAATIILSVLNQPTPNPKTLNPNIPRDLETICLKALAKDSELRYSSCDDLAADLGRWLEYEPIHARRLRLAERLVRWFRKEPLIVGLLELVFAVSLVGLATVSWQWRKTQTNFAEAERQRTLAEKNLTEADHQKEIAKAN